MFINGCSRTGGLGFTDSLFDYMMGCGRNRTLMYVEQVLSITLENLPFDCSFKACPLLKVKASLLPPSPPKERITWLENSFLGFLSLMWKGLGRCSSRMQELSSQLKFTIKRVLEVAWHH